jgi:hypothetical protein
VYVLLPRPHAQLARKRRRSVVVTAAVKDAVGKTLTLAKRATLKAPRRG